MSPHLLCLPPGGVTALRERANTPELKRYADRLVTRCDRWLALPPVERPPTPSTREDRSPRELMRARQAQGRIVSLAAGWLVTANRAYLDRCWTEILPWLDTWDSWTDPYHGTRDEYDLMVGEVALGLGLAYDWLKADLGPERAAKLSDHLGRRALDLYLGRTEGPDRAWWCGATHNWNAVCNGGAIVAALALEGEHPRAGEVIGRATHFLGGYIAALGAEGGCDEGLGYWQYGMRYCVAALAALRDAGHDITPLTGGAGFRHTARFPLSFIPGGIPISWGDAASTVVDPCLYWLAAATRDPEVVRYADRVLAPNDPDHEGWQSEAMTLCWRPVGEAWLPTPGSPSTRSTAHVWPEIGWSCFTDSWEAPRLACGMKCGDLGANHTHLDNLGFLLWARGEWLASDLGAPPIARYGGDYFSDKRWDMYLVKTAGHNAPLIGGAGQKPDTKGVLAPLPALSPRIVGAVGDATSNYGTPVRRARRHLAVVDCAVLVVVDEVETAGEVPVEWRLHTAHPATVDGPRARVAAPRASLAILFPPGLSSIRVEQDPGHLAPDTLDTVVCASTLPATAHLLPVVLAPGGPDEAGPRAEFHREDGVLRIGIQRPGGTVTLTWSRGPDGWALTAVR